MFPAHKPWIRKQTTMRNLLLICALAILAAGPAGAQTGTQVVRQHDEMPIDDQPGFVPGADEENLPAAFRRQAVFFRTTEPPGTVIVHTSERFLYIVQGNNRALRYGVGVGRDGFRWAGMLQIS